MSSRPVRITLVAAALLTWAGSSRADGIQVALQTPSGTVAPGSLFEVDIQVTASGAAFNAYDAVVGFDPAALTFVAMSPLSLQEGSLMKGACGNTTVVFHSAPDSLRISHSLLCNSLSVTGPGTLYKLQFRASNTPQITHVVFRRRAGFGPNSGLQFYDAGLYVGPAASQDLAVGIGMTVGVGVAPSTRALAVIASPNPSRGSVHIQLDSGDHPGPARLRVFDAAGRMVRQFADLPSGRREFTWDGRDGSGTPVPSGSYFLLARSGARTARARLLIAH